MAPQLVPYLLFLHVFGAILAFGPTFAFSFMGAMAAKEPQHANFSARQSALVSNRLVYPFAILQGITGLLIIWAGQLSRDVHDLALDRHRAVPHRGRSTDSPSSARLSIA